MGQLEPVHKTAKMLAEREDTFYGGKHISLLGRESNGLRR
jgi:hypothetical protein